MGKRTEVYQLFRFQSLALSVTRYRLQIGYVGTVSVGFASLMTFILNYLFLILLRTFPKSAFISILYEKTGYSGFLSLTIGRLFFFLFGRDLGDDPGEGDADPCTYGCFDKPEQAVHIRRGILVYDGDD